MDALNTIVFEGKNFSQILNEIYNNQTEKKAQILTLISQLKPLIKDTGDATLLVPLIKDYLDISVKNDDHLIKLANLIQKVTVAPNGTGGELFSEEEKNALLKEYKQITEESEK